MEKELHSFLQPRNIARHVTPRSQEPNFFSLKNLQKKANFSFLKFSEFYGKSGTSLTAYASYFFRYREQLNPLKLCNFNLSFPLTKKIYTFGDKFVLIFPVSPGINIRNPNFLTLDFSSESFFDVFPRETIPRGNDKDFIINHPHKHRAIDLPLNGKDPLQF